MPRVIPTGLLQALTAETPQVFLAVEIFFPSAPLRLWTGRNTRNIGGDIFIGGGTALAFGEVEETGQIVSTETTITLSGVSRDAIALALREPYQMSPVKLYMGEISATPDMIQIGSGYVDQMPIEDGAETATISCIVVNILADLERPRIMRYTHEDQQLLFPGDMVFEFVAELQDSEIDWY